MHKKIAIRLGIAIALFCASLLLPAFAYGEPGQARATVPGIDALLTGVAAALLGLLGLLRGDVGMLGTVAWFANPLLLLAWLALLVGRRDAAVLCSVVAFVLTLAFLCVRTMESDHGLLHHVFPSYGYVLWILSAIVTFSGATHEERVKVPLRTFKT